ncbi:5-oxoprolinase subunit PxpA [soil metagenome]
MRIDLNADVDEGLDEVDAALIPLVTSANIACGGHAGDEVTMVRTVEQAHRHDVTIGAHPGYPDREGFGRRRMELSTDELRDTILVQLERLDSVVRHAGATIRHVKPHGALYNAAAADVDVAMLVADAIRALSPTLVLVGRAGSRLLDAGRAAGLPVAAEGFADRAYEPDGSLRPRDRAGAVFHEPAHVAEQAVSIARDRRAPLEAGGWVAVEADTICLHGDAPGAAASAVAVREALARAGIDVATFAQGG